jgi:ribosomal protein S18 acetylase RimI-like enzyme
LCDTWKKALIAQLACKKNRTGIRPLNPARDLGQLADLVENAFGDELSEGGARVLREIRLLSKLGPLNHLLVGTNEVDGLFTGFVWEQDGRVVGSVTVNRPTGHPHRWQISNVAVLDTYRRQGIGQRLVEEAIALIVRRGGRSAYLFVRDDNPPAMELYGSLGFVKVDETTELKLDEPFLSSRPAPLHTLQPLSLAQGQAVYELVRRAVAPGHYWLYAVRRNQYVRSADERLLHWLESLFTGETELRWGVAEHSALRAAVILHATRLWNLGPHRLQFWIHPNWRERIAEPLADDIISILSEQSRRPTYVVVPACEERAAAALIEAGFRQIKTLLLMKLDL